MDHTILQLITAMTGSMGFALLFHVRPRLVLPAALGGFFNWWVYLISARFFDGVLTPSVITAAFSAIYAELMARRFKAPATVFFIPTMIPLIPGSTLYYTMSSIVAKDWNAAKELGYTTAQYALGIAAGASLIWTLNDIIKKACTLFSQKS